MIFERLKSRIVSHLSYFVGSGRDVFVVDPQRNIQPYVELARKYRVNIKYIFETHRNEDYIAGSLELAEITGARIFHGPWPDFKYGETLKDGQEFKVGALKITAIHTPGHTPGCFSFSLIDIQTGNVPVMIFSGDTLFIGDTGRTDFGGPMLLAEWSGNLYDSIHNKLLSLGDHVKICPAHGSGSICGSKIARREESTLGAERLMNPQLALNRKQFIEYKRNERHHYMPYFKLMEVYNKDGIEPYGYGNMPKAMAPTRFEEMIAKGAIVLDTRPPPAFAVGHIAGSYNVYESSLGGAGWLLPFDKPILLVLGNTEHLENIVHGLASIGYDNVKGYLKGTIVTWYQAAKALSSFNTMVADDLNAVLTDSNWAVFDVRSEDEFDAGHIPGTENLYYGTIVEKMDQIPRDKNIALYCASGARSGIASSILHREGFKVSNVLGGLLGWRNAGNPVEK